MGILDIWYLHAYPGRENPLVKPDAKTSAVIRKAVGKASTQTNLAMLNKVAEKLPKGDWQFREDPPVLTRVVDKKARNDVIQALHDYAPTLYRERQFMFTKYHVVDIAHRVVGVGSVGTRAYLVLLFGNSENDPLFLQVKQGMPPAHAPYAPPGLEEFAHDGKRIVTFMPTPAEASWLAPTHAPPTPPHSPATAANPPYSGGALALWAEAYGDQTVEDHAALVNAFKNDRKVQAMMGV